MKPDADAAALPRGLYLIATPIGNLGDITERARQILASVNIIFCEDTRHSRKLLDRISISRELVSCHEHNESNRIPDAISRVGSGEAIALITDAGTPAISDPGFRVVRAFRKAGLPVIPVPGPCALITALSISGLPTDSFRFFGFLPPKSAARKRTFAEFRDETATLIFYESTHRAVKFLEDLGDICGLDRFVCVARELTKVHESVHTGPLGEVINVVKSGSQKGEFVIMVAKEGFQW